MCVYVVCVCVCGVHVYVSVHMLMLLWVLIHMPAELHRAEQTVGYLALSPPALLP